MDRTDIHIGDRVGTIKGRGVVSVVNNDKYITVDLDGDHGSYMFHKDSVWKIVTGLNAKQFIEEYCHNCGSQRCEGIGTEWFDGCRFKDCLNT